MELDVVKNPDLHYNLMQIRNTAFRTGTGYRGIFFSFNFLIYHCVVGTGMKKFLNFVTIRSWSRSCQNVAGYATLGMSPIKP